MSSNEDIPREPEPEEEEGEGEGEESTAADDGSTDSTDPETTEGDRPIIIQGGSANPV